MSLHLSDKTVLANFSVSRWMGHRFDRKVTDEVNKAQNAASDTGRYNKRLLPPGASSKVDAVTSAARTFHRMQTMPWMDDGVRILPATKYLEYAAKMKEFRQEFDEEVVGFLKAYPSHIETAKKRLGKMFNAADYPSANELRKSFDWKLVILPFPDADDFRVLSQGPELDEVKADLEARVAALWDDAMKDTAERIVEVVGHMKEKLKGYKPGKGGKRAEGTFKDSLVGNVRELADLLPGFNLTNDKKLGSLITKIQKELCKHDAGLLRDDDKIRKRVAKSADEVLTAVSDFMA